MQVLMRGAALLLTMASATAVRAEVVQKADNGFVVRNAVEVTATPSEAWRALIDPAKWWSGQHTFSGDAANLSLDPVPGGCFCERLPASSSALIKGLPAGQREGGVQHMRVIYAEPLRAMRLTGSLGPLQSEALSGTLTMTLKPVGTGTRILWEYVVGGFMRYKTDEIGPAVDKVLLGQLTSLGALLGPVASAASGAAPADTAPSAAADATPASEAKPDPQPAKSGGASNWSLPPAAPKPAKARPASAAPAASATAAAVKPALARPATKPAQKPAAAPAAKAAAKPPLKPARKAASQTLSAEEIQRREANAAFDAALGKVPDQ